MDVRPGDIVTVRSGRQYVVLRTGTNMAGRPIAVAKAADGTGPVRYLPISGLTKAEQSDDYYAIHDGGIRNTRPQ